jgi:hypothetical protein
MKFLSIKMQNLTFRFDYEIERAPGFKVLTAVIFSRRLGRAPSSTPADAQIFFHG